MAHAVDGLIIRAGVTLGLPDMPETTPAKLRQGFRFVPSSLDVDSLLAKRYEARDQSTRPEFPLISRAFLAYACDLSTKTAVAVVHTEYFGGFGEQSAALFRDGRPILGPLTRKVDGPETKQAPGPGPINRVLREMGVRRAGARDEFEAVGLHELRDMDRWSS